MLAGLKSAIRQSWAYMVKPWAPNIDKPKNGFDVTLRTQDVAEARRWIAALPEGGKVSMPFGEAFWSPGDGSLTDKFGIPWMVNATP